MKNKLLVFGAIVCLAAILAAGTLAYFTDDVVTHNVITSDAVDIDIVEKTLNEKGDLIDWPDKGVSGVMPDTSVIKQVSVKNLSLTQTAWVRVKLNCTINDGALPSENMVEYEIREGWTLDEDGYYRYEKPVAPNTSTPLIIEKVTFAKEMGNEYQNCTAILTVDAQAVQYRNNEHGDDVMKVPGWPEAPAN